MTDYTKCVLFLSVFAAGFSFPAYLATRALYRGEIYGGSEHSERWHSREKNPIHFWFYVVFYYAMSLAGWTPLFLVLTGIWKVLPAS